MATDAERAYVTDQLRGQGASLFTPLVGADDIDFAVRGAEGQYVEVQVLGASGGPRRFQVGRFRPKPHAFFACVGTDGGAPSEVWLLPSGTMERFAESTMGSAGQVLDLDADDDGEPLSERLSVFKDRWVLMTQFSKFRSALADPVALKMRIAFG